MNHPNNNADLIEFSINAIWSKDKYGKLYTSQLGKNCIDFSCPIPFGGVEGKISPEEMFLSSLATCTLTTILHLIDKVRTTIDKLSVSIESSIIKLDNQDYEFNEIICNINLYGKDPDDEFLYERICSLTPNYCLIKKSISNKILYNFLINDKIYNPEI